MERKRRQVALLTGLGIVVVAAVYLQWPRRAGMTAPAPSSLAAARINAGRMPGTAPDVHLESLDTKRPVPSDGQRNLFKFQSKPAPSRSVAPPVVSAPAAPSGPPPAPPLPPIPLNFIGVLENTRESQKIAVLSDGRGVYHGSEGDIIEGRYRILRIGVESIDLAYLDGRGRQTIRKSGS